MLVNKQLAVWEVSIVLGDVAVLVGCSGFLRDAFGILFLREFRFLPCCACCAPEEYLLSLHDFMLKMCGGYVVRLVA
jgi:hypothetical protein